MKPIALQLGAVLVLSGLAGPALAQEQVPQQPSPPTKAPAAAPGPAHISDSANDKTNVDNLGVTGWSGSWTANEARQGAGDAGSATTDQAKPLVVPPAK